MSRDPKDIGRLLELVVHDLRNPAATIGANVSFAQAAAHDGDPELVESLADVEQALGDLVRGLRHLGRVARWLTDAPLEGFRDADVRDGILDLRDLPEGTTVRTSVPDEPLRARGGTAVGELLEALLANSVQHAPGGVVDVTANAHDSETIEVTVTDTGPAVAPDLRREVFSLEAQDRVKVRADGRYGRAAGMVAVRLVVEAIGGSVEVGGVDGAATVTLCLARAPD